MPHAVRAQGMQPGRMSLRQQACIAAVLAQSAQESKSMMACWQLQICPTLLVSMAVPRLWLMLLAAQHI